MPNDEQTTDKKDKPCGCSGDIKFPEINKHCEAPVPMPYSDCGNCLKWFITTIVNRQGSINPGNEPNIQVNAGVNVQFEIVYEFSLCLKGKQPGKLLYTTSLIPQEELKIYISDLFRKTTSATAMVSVQSTLKNSVSALHESQQSGSFSDYTDTLKKSSSSGGSSVSFLGLFGGSNSQSSSNSTENIQSLQSASSNFQQILTAASSSVEAQRSVVVSSYEDQENLNVTTRTLKNYNNCNAVTYYVRQVNEVYEFTAKIYSVRWRVTESRLNILTDWQSVNDIATLQNEALKKLLETMLSQLPKQDEQIKSDRCFTLPTDGTMLETELAHCSSCDGERMLELELKLERQKAETRKINMHAELMQLEIERRKKLLAAGNLNVFDEAEQGS